MKDLNVFHRMGKLSPVFLFTPVFIMAVSLCFSQNVGIGVDSPTEKLQVGGVVHSMIDGFRFPDGTVQSTASSDYEPEQAGDNRLLAVLQLYTPSIPGPFNFDTLQNVIKIIDYEWGMTSVDGGSGSSVITISHVVIMKDMDVTTNQLLQKALDGGPPLADVRLFFYREYNGDIQPYYTVFLENVIIRSFTQQLVFKGGEQFSHLDIIALEFTDSEWVYGDGTTSNNATWTSP